MEPLPGSWSAALYACPCNHSQSVSIDMILINFNVHQFYSLLDVTVSFVPLRRPCLRSTTIYPPVCVSGAVLLSIARCSIVRPFLLFSFFLATFSQSTDRLVFRLLAGTVNLYCIRWTDGWMVDMHRRDPDELSPVDVYRKRAAKRRKTYLCPSSRM